MTRIHEACQVALQEFNLCLAAHGAALNDVATATMDYAQKQCLDSHANIIDIARGLSDHRDSLDKMIESQTLQDSKVISLGIQCIDLRAQHEDVLNFAHDSIRDLARQLRSLESLIKNSQESTDHIESTLVDHNIRLSDLIKESNAQHGLLTGHLMTSDIDSVNFKENVVSKINEATSIFENKAFRMIMDIRTEVENTGMPSVNQRIEAAQTDIGMASRKCDLAEKQMATMGRKLEALDVRMKTLELPR